MHKNNKNITILRYLMETYVRMEGLSTGKVHIYSLPKLNTVRATINLPWQTRDALLKHGWSGVENVYTAYDPDLDLIIITRNPETLEKYKEMKLGAKRISMKELQELEKRIEELEKKLG